MEGAHGTLVVYHFGMVFESSCTLMINFVVLLQYVGSFEVSGEDQKECAENVRVQLLQMKVAISRRSSFDAMTTT